MFIKTEKLSLQNRIIYAEIAAGFLYQGRDIIRVKSLKPGFTADLALKDLADGRQVIIWTRFDEEASILAEMLNGRTDLALLTGKTPKDKRPGIIDKFRSGRLPLLITRAGVLGFGLNFQNCSSMIFSGFDDSYERFYQAVRRCYRYGQTKTVRVHIPYIPDLEGVVLANVKEKESRINEEISHQEAGYKLAIKELHQ